MHGDHWEAGGLRRSEGERRSQMPVQLSVNVFDFDSTRAAMNRRGRNHIFDARNNDAGVDIGAGNPYRQESGYRDEDQI